MPGLFDDPECAIRRMVPMLRGLQAHHRWVTWPALARQLTGSDEFAAMTEGLASLPEFSELFRMNHSGVQLSPAGLAFNAAPVPAEQDHFGEQIGFAVRRYAAQLDRDQVSVTGCLARIPVAGGRIVHAFQVPTSDNYFATETPVKFHSTVTGTWSSGKLVGHDLEGQLLYATLDHEVMPTDLPGRLLVDKAFLLTKLADNLEGLKDRPPLFAFEAIADSGLQHVNSVELASLLFKLPPPWTRLLWGPPGSGKTHGVGFLALQLLAANPLERILLVAPSNKAVDVSFSQIVTQVRGSTVSQLIRSRQLFRFGYPRDDEILRQPELLGPEGLDALVQTVRQMAKRLSTADHENARPEDLAVMRAELIAAQEKLKQAVAAHVLQARVVATTAALAFSGGLGTSRWDTVIVDEVTMVPVAVLAYLSSLATKRFLLAGDPLQLGPVFENGGQLTDWDRRWMGMDAFEWCGISAWQGNVPKVNLSNPRLARITKQRRCPERLWSFVAGLYPSVATATGVTGARQDLLALPPSPDEAVPVLDTAAMNATCSEVNGSWKNESTAVLALEVARTAVAEAERPIKVAIITPYRAQVRLLQSWLREERRAFVGQEGMSRIEVGTVHQFQGSEADLVIFDVVDGPGRNSLGLLLRGQQGMRMVNVAITRSRGKVVILANTPWCERVNIQQQNPLLHDLVVARQAGVRISVVAAENKLPLAATEGIESPIEQELLNAMRQFPSLAGVSLQHRIVDKVGRIVSRADFAFPEIRLAIYCDGRQWHCVENSWQTDLRQRNQLASLGWRHLVYSGRDILRDAANCASQIAEMLSQSHEP